MRSETLVVYYLLRALEKEEAVWVLCMRHNYQGTDPSCLCTFHTSANCLGFFKTRAEKTVKSQLTASFQHAKLKNTTFFCFGKKK